MSELSNAHAAFAAIKAIAPHFHPRIGIVLGSGLGSFGDFLEEAISIPYSSLPGFPTSMVSGHAGNLVLGYIASVPVVCLQGRAHGYEGEVGQIIKTYVRTLKLLGCEYFFATNASGSLQKEVGPGELMLITDHINFQPLNPLLGPNEEEFGPRFYPLDNAYDLATRTTLLALAKQQEIALFEGVYIAVTGPHYETAAEIRAFQQWGAHAVGMSTVPEVLVANHCGMKVAVIATITNFATGLTSKSHHHEEVLMKAKEASFSLNRLLLSFIASLPCL